MKTILITGCAGFIGTNLCLRILKDPEEQDTQIIGVDNLLTSRPPTFKHERFVFHQWDVVRDAHKFLDLPNIDEIYHLASIASPPKYKKYPIETLNVNIIGTKNMLELAVKHDAKFLLTSTSEVYGDPLEHPQKESYYGNVNPVGERSCYDESKRCAETYVYEYRRKYGKDFKICRIFNTYGPYMDIDDGRVITNIIKQVIDNRPVTIYGDGTQTRSFCYIDDMLDGLTILMQSSECGPINLGNPRTECSMNDLVCIFESVVGFKIITRHVDKMENDPMLRRPDISVAQEKLGFYPRTGLEEGIHKTIIHFASMN
jgi:UDP-glucuronate decarboxylase